MARRAGVVPFSLLSTPIDLPWSATRSTASTSPSEEYTCGEIGIEMEQGMGMGMLITEGPPMLPSVAEMTTGMTPYSTPAYSVSKSMFSCQPCSSSIPALPSTGYALYASNVGRKESSALTQVMGELHPREDEHQRSRKRHGSFNFMQDMASMHVTPRHTTPLFRRGAVAVEVANYTQ